MKKIAILLIVLMMVSVGLLSGCNEQKDISPVINSFTVTPAVITLGGTSVLNWSVRGAKSVSIDNGIGNVALNGSYTVVPTINKTYILTAFNSYGKSSASVVVIVNPLASEKNTSPIVFTVEELWQKKDSYVGDRIAVEGFYYISNDGPSLVQATTVSNPNPTIWIILDETSLNSAKQAADITLISNLEYHVVGVLQEIPFPVGSGFKFIVESIDAV